MSRERKLLVALAISLLIHGFFLFATGRWASGMPGEIGFAIEAHLAALEPPPEAAPVALGVAPREPAPAEAPPATPTPPVEPAATEPPSEPPSESRPREAPPLDMPALAPPRDEPAFVPPPADALPMDGMPRDDLPRDTIAPSGPTPRMLAVDLPERAEARYTVRYGSGGFAAGEARYSLQTRDGRYVLSSNVEAKGLASLFVSGRIVQTSEGMLAAEGLRPEQYASRQGERRSDSARFDWQAKQLVLGGNRGNAPLSPGAQDLLSFPFHLAATARPGEPEFNLAVSNGRKLLDYRFAVLGMETLELPLGKVDALHVRGQRDGEGSLEVWLDPARGNLPVMVRTLDQKGKEVTLVAEEVAYTPVTSPTLAPPTEVRR